MVEEERRREKWNSPNYLHLNAIFLSPLVGHRGIKIFRYAHATCEGVAILSQHWSSTSSDLDRSGRCWRERVVNA